MIKALRNRDAHVTVGEQATRLVDLELLLIAGVHLINFGFDRRVIDRKCKELGDSREGDAWRALQSALRDATLLFMARHGDLSIPVVLSAYKFLDDQNIRALSYNRSVLRAASRGPINLHAEDGKVFPFLLI